jgi:hypothetical protein
MSFIKYLLEEHPPQTGITDDTMVLVPGVGQMRYGQLRQQVAAKLDDLNNRVQSGDVDWKSVKWMLTNSTLHAYVDTLINLQDVD